MQNSDQEKQDQRITCNMEDSNMTIEFLRARLLSERSVSKSARQRADELARRVAELEEQLRIVSVQRRMAEKATADVLAILENNGVSDVTEELDSSSDQDTPFESNMDNVSTKEEERSVSLEVRRKEEELSGSDDFSSVSGRSLSWKGRKNASRSPDKYKDSLVRRRNNFSSMGFLSPKHWQGKSCRQIRHRESRLVAEEPKSDDVKAGSPVNEPVTSPEVKTNQSKSEKDMEKALEHQAQLIDRYEAMKGPKENGKRSSEKIIVEHRIHVILGTTRTSLRKEMRSRLKLNMHLGQVAHESNRQRNYLKLNPSILCRLHMVIWISYRIVTVAAPFLLRP